MTRGRDVRRPDATPRAARAGPGASAPAPTGGASPRDRRLLLLGGLALLAAMGLIAWTHGVAVDRQYRSLRATGVRVDVNAADVETLSMLDQIGPERARRIVEWRAQNGPFRTYPDLMRVTGIGPRTMEDLVGQVWFGPESIGP